MTRVQRPLPSGLNFKTTAQEVIRGLDLRGHVAIVTGGAAGIGLETSCALSHAGATVVAAVRQPAKAADALAVATEIEIEQLDLIDPSSIAAFADRFLASGRPLHILVNNAGIMANPLTRDARGYETQFATNHLGHFELAVRLWPALRAARGARIISLSSRGHRFSAFNFEDPNFTSRLYDPWIAYGQSKTANALFAVAADRRGLSDQIRAFSVHPGRILQTGLSRFMSDAELDAVPLVDQLGEPFTDPVDYVKSPAQGAATSVWCATSTQLERLGGLYCEDCDVALLVPAQSQGLGVRPYAIDQVLAERLWVLSERLTSLEFVTDPRAH
jgi:NAD(P)-dependent dehydrogenase (short-subunit alcohol dehydrogenase family)